MTKKTLVLGLLIAACSTNYALAEDDFIPDKFVAANDPESLTLSESASYDNDKFLPGFFLQLQGGWAADGFGYLHNFDWQRGLQFKGGDGWAGRIAAGYDFNPKFAVDLGLLYFGVKSGVTKMTEPTHGLDSSRTMLADLNAKFTLPFIWGINSFVKLGVGYSQFSGNEKYYPICNQHGGFVFGSGYNYYFTPKISMEISWMHYDGVAILQKMTPDGLSFLHYQPSSNFYAVGLAYKFGDMQQLENIEDNESSLEPHPFESGLYFGLQGGYADSGWGNFSHFADSDYFLTVTGDNGPGFRAYAGYDFNEHWGLEAGYTYILNSALIGHNTYTPAERFHQISAVKNQAVDALIKSRWPIVEGFAFYVKSGIGYMKATGLRDSDGTSPSTKDPMFANNEVSHLGAVYAVGFSYDMTENFTIDISGTRFLGNPTLERTPGDLTHGPTFKQYQPNLNLFMLGLQYKI